ncbi:hypothetical protein [Acinetobacter sp.]|uniref:hypothetical protein n=1 Tax=Acinetobacter sp. TaxID=472 RepID=UPI003D04E9E0
MDHSGKRAVVSKYATILEVVENVLTQYHQDKGNEEFDSNEYFNRILLPFLATIVMSSTDDITFEIGLAIALDEILYLSKYGQLQGDADNKDGEKCTCMKCSTFRALNNNAAFKLMLVEIKDTLAELQQQMDELVADDGFDINNFSIGGVDDDDDDDIEPWKRNYGSNLN